MNFSEIHAVCNVRQNYIPENIAHTSKTYDLNNSALWQSYEEFIMVTFNEASIFMLKNKIFFLVHKVNF